METTPTLSSETVEILESLTFIEKECLAAWQNSTKTPKELGLLREARACIQLKMKLLGLDQRKPASAPELTETESSASPAEPAATPESGTEPPKKPDGALLNAFRQEFTPERFRALDTQSWKAALQRYCLTEADVKAMGY